MQLLSGVLRVEYCTVFLGVIYIHTIVVVKDRSCLLVYKTLWFIHLQLGRQVFRLSNPISRIPSRVLPDLTKDYGHYVSKLSLRILPEMLPMVNIYWRYGSPLVRFYSPTMMITVTGSIDYKNDGCRPFLKALIQSGEENCSNEKGLILLHESSIWKSINRVFS